MKSVSKIFLLWLFLVPGLALAQLPTGDSDSAESTVLQLDDPTSKAAVREMISKLSDDDVRALLIQRLDAVAEAHEAKADNQQSAVDVFKIGFNSWVQHVTRAVTHPGLAPKVLADIIAKVRESLGSAGLGGVLLILLLAIGAGLIAERVVAWLLRNKKQQLIEKFSTDLWEILKTIYTRLFYDLLGVGAFAIVSTTLISAQLDRGSLGFLFAYLWLAAIMGGWFGYVICRFFFAPNRPDLRICNTSDEKAKRLTMSFSLLAAYIVFAHNFWHLMETVGFDRLGGWDEVRPLGFFVGISMYIAAIFVIWINRDALTEILNNNRRRVNRAMGDDTQQGENSWFARNWPTIAIVLLIMKYACVNMVLSLTDLAAYSVLAVYITFTAIFLWPSIDANVSLFVGRGIKAADDESEAASRSRRRMQQALLRVGRVVVVSVLFYTLASLWGMDLLHLAEAGLGAQVAGKFVELVLIGLTAYVLWELVGIFCERWLVREGGQLDDHGESPGGGDAGGVGLSRVATLLPIIRRTLQVLIVVVAVVMVLNNWGVNIGPLIAGAGVIGLAIGFGAQTLVKDIVSGMFFLADDAFRVGEYIDVGGTMGNVEKISLRSLRLRHHRGLVHTIPYGEIPKLTNFSRDWVIMKLRFRVPFETDVNKVKKIFKQIGKDLLEHEDLGDDFLQPFKSQGVAEVDESGMVVRGKFMAKPGKQFMIRKELYVRVQKAFEEAGIPFARKQVMVHIPGLENANNLDAESAQRVGAAAAEEVLSQDEAAEAAKPKPA